ncbi:hypothetical protein Pth03_46100 [Planotetraspora thailandica]|uniref:Uncharacterized protein n=2 Tax=Planotetraspora thailandica TaxID=487172 RepID=A0A8J3V794_9ACTN|nr:hypothetical protein Pth03_46100 [Planotetraspora thailandica]
MRNLIDRLARVPLQAVGAAITLGAVLMATQSVLIDYVHSTGRPEPEQWIGGLTVKWYFELIPIAFIALWARRRDRERHLGRVGAVMLTSGPIMHIVVTVSAIVWGGLLGKGDLPEGVMMVETLMYVMYLGALISGVAFLFDKGVRWWGAAVVAGILLDLFVPYGGAVMFALFGIALALYGLRRPVSVDMPEPSIAR